MDFSPVELVTALGGGGGLVALLGFLVTQGNRWRTAGVERKEARENRIERRLSRALDARDEAEDELRLFKRHASRLERLLIEKGFEALIPPWPTSQKPGSTDAADRKSR